MSSFENIKGTVIAASSSKEWETAKTEWSIVDIYLDEEGDTCSCEKVPIKEVCIIYNSVTKTDLVVGNSCVKQFMADGEKNDLIFAAIKGVKESGAKSLNEAAIEWAMKKGWLTQWEHDFYLDTLRQQACSEKQLAVREKINEKIMAHLCARPDNRPPVESVKWGDLIRARKP